MGIEPTQPAWKAGILAIELHPHMCGTQYILPHQFLKVNIIYILFYKYQLLPSIQKATALQAATLRESTPFDIGIVTV